MNHVGVCDSGECHAFLNKDVIETGSASKGIIDCGCPTNVTGRKWLNLFEQSLNGKKLKRKPCNEKFKFGPSSFLFQNRRC